MPTATTCIWEGKEIRVVKALEIRNRDNSVYFLCTNCGNRVKPHTGGGHTGAHFEHFERNPECPNSHSDSYRYRGKRSDSYKNTDTYSGIEGYAIERKYLALGRNIGLVI